MADRIVLRGVRAHGYHGVLAHEREHGQEFVIDVTLELCLQEAAESDEVADTVSYAEVAEAVVAAVEGLSVKLIETLAERILSACLEFERVDAAEVCVHKPHAPIAVSFEDVSVSMRRERERAAIEPHPRFAERRSGVAA